MSQSLSVDFAFGIGERVSIKALNMPAEIVARMDSGNGLLEYRAVWWSDGARKAEWLYAFELERRI